MKITNDGKDFQPSHINFEERGIWRCHRVNVRKEPRGQTTRIRKFIHLFIHFTFVPPPCFAHRAIATTLRSLTNQRV
uniref:Uncharacterized protein n=1 Tax=Anguilla anguilla TaxID=7936 RepID=A0A0E9X829_ANGAN